VPYKRFIKGINDMSPNDPSHVRIFDSTLRDGEQSPGASMNLEEKLEVARHLAKLNVDIIEAGFPISSPVQFEAVKNICGEIEGPVICGLARTIEKDIKVAADALNNAKHWRIHTFTSTSPTHMEHMLRMTPDQVLKAAVAAVEYAASLTSDVEFSGQDAPRSDINFVYEILEAVIAAGATTLNIPDTVGYSSPDEYGTLIANIKKNVPNIDKVTISTHCHNDLGMATANSLAGVINGARQIECTINGIGERAGNASLEEVVMAIKTRKDIYGLTTQINPKEIYRASTTLARLTGLQVQVNKAIVGDNAFAHESGIHVDGYLKNRETYEIMTPESVGVNKSRLVLGRHSGMHGFKVHVKEMGYTLDDTQLKATFARFLEIADKKKEVTDDDIDALLGDQVTDTQSAIVLEHVEYSAQLDITSNKDDNTKPHAIVKVRLHDKVIEKSSTGDGAVDAILTAISKATGLSPKFENYKISAVTGETDALAEAIIHIKDKASGDVFTGRSARTDVVYASAIAYVNALNRMLVKQAKVK
jgi:2-isopropylmalate synthase